MSRYRPPRPASSPHITPEGYQSLQTELNGLWDKRQDVVKHLAAAAAEGDRSENAEYIYRKKQLREIDRRIGYLQRRMPKLNVVERRPGDAPDQIFFGATVTLVDESDVETTYRLVGADEFDAERNWISIDSPMAKALLKRQLDDEVTVQTPGGTHLYWVTDITYC